MNFQGKKGEHVEILRQRIREIDQSIIDLLARRFHEVVQIGKWKRDHHVPLRDWAYEKEILERLEHLGSKRGIPRVFIRRLMQIIFEESRRLQEPFYSALSPDHGAKRICIVGGYGQMGQWFARFFSDYGHQVFCYDTRPKEGIGTAVASLAKGIEASNVMCVATPLPTIRHIFDELVREGYRGLVFDIGSLKSPWLEELPYYRKHLRITSIHPMFGPRARTLSDKVCIICDCGVEEATQAVRALFSDSALSLVTIPVQLHDRYIAYVLGLSHFVNMLVALTFTHTPWSIRELEQMGSTTFFAQIETTRTVLNDNMELYFHIQHDNPYMERVYEHLKKSMETLVNYFRHGEEHTFMEFIAQVRRKFTDDAD